MIQIGCWPLISRSILWLLSCLHVQPLPSVSFDIGIPYLAHGFITMRECVKCIHDSDTTLNFDIKVKIYRVCDMALCSGLSYFVLWHGHTLFGTWVFHHGTMCGIHSWTLYDPDLWPQYQNYTGVFESGKMPLLFDIGIPNFGIWVYHHETTCCVHSWP